MRLFIVVGLFFNITLAFAQVAEPPDSDTLEISPVVITGSRTAHTIENSPVPVEVITKEDIEATGGDTLADVLDGQIGVSVDRSFRGSTVRVQGLDSKYVLILVDGERVGGRLDGAIDLSRIHVDNIERVEIVKGATCALYGSDAMGGVINIITRRSNRPVEGNARVTYGTGIWSEAAPALHAIDASAGVGYRKDGWNTRTTAGWHSIEAYDLEPETIATTGSQLRQWEISNRTSYDFSDRNQLHGSVSYSQRDQQGIDGNASGAVYDRRNVIEYLRASVGPEFGVGDSGMMKITGSYHLNRDQYLSDQRQSIVQDKDEESIEHLVELNTQLTQLAGEQHLFTGGMDTLFQKLKTPRLNGGEGDRFRIAVFFQDEWTPSESPLIQVVPGVRVDVDSQFGMQSSPKASLRYSPIEELTLRTSYGVGFRAPGFKELFLRFENPGAGYVVDGNPDLEPETSESLNASMHFNPVRWFEASVSAFRNDISNLIDAQTVSLGGEGLPQQFSYVNVAEAFTQGVDTQLAFHFAKHWTVMPGYSYLDTGDKETGRQLEGRSRQRGFLEAAFHQREWRTRITSRGTFVGPRIYYTPGDDDPAQIVELETDHHILLDARLSQGIGDYVSVILQGENLLDAGDIATLPMQPRTLTAGLQGRF